MGPDAIDLLEQGKIGADGALRSLWQDRDGATDGGRRTIAETKISIKDSLALLNSLIGLERPKQEIRDCIAYAQMQSLRKGRGLKGDPMAMHMAFSGNPGTGKTSLARIVGRICSQLNMLSKGHLLEVDRSDLVGEYIGHTAQKTKKAIQKAMGGILFVDEAYSLHRGDERDFGLEAIDTLVKEIEDHRHDIILIVAGYPEEMDDFLDSNPGFQSRIPIHIRFPDYTLDELLKISQSILLQREYYLSSDGERKLCSILRRKLEQNDRGNGRLVRNILEKAFRHQASRLILKGDILCNKDMMELKGIDFRGEKGPWPAYL